MTTNITVKVKRLWHGKVSVRSTIVDKAKVEGKGLDIHCEGKTMVVDSPDLSHGVLNAHVFQSKHNVGETYRLVDFEWITAGSPEQMRLF